MHGRRSFLVKTGIGVLAIPFLANCKNFTNKITHIVSISFDDGFERSFNVIGDFDLWNELKRRGHEIMPHGYKHENLGRIALADAQKLILKSLDYFSENLDDFDPLKAIFNFPFNSSTEELEEWLKDKVLAFRTAGNAINKLPHKRQKKLTCISAGPDNIDLYFEEQLQKFLSEPKGWFIFNAHGLDGEGWGPMNSSYLDELLDRLLGMKHVSILTVGRALLSL
jgi:hypothetical protein